MSSIKEEMRVEGSRVILNGYGKINLALDVVGKRPDGYHEVRMIMQQIQLHDRITVEKGDRSGQILLEASREDLPVDERNIAYKAAALMRNVYNLESGVVIRIEKNIPVAAGLAGGSADGAAVLMGMNELFQIGLNKEKLCALGLRLGADVPFCILGVTFLGWPLRSVCMASTRSCVNALITGMSSSSLSTQPAIISSIGTCRMRQICASRSRLMSFAPRSIWPI